MDRQATTSPPPPSERNGPPEYLVVYHIGKRRPYLYDPETGEALWATSEEGNLVSEPALKDNDLATMSGDAYQAEHEKLVRTMDDLGCGSEERLECWDPVSKKCFFYDKRTRRSFWDPPAPALVEASAPTSLLDQSPLEVPGEVRHFGVAPSVVSVSADITAGGGGPMEFGVEYILSISLRRSDGVCAAASFRDVYRGQDNVTEVPGLPPNTTGS